MAGAFDLKKAANGQYYFNLKAGNGEVILTSEMYVEKRSAEAGIASVQTNAPKDERYSREESANGKFYFTLKAGNHQVIGMSQMYTTAAARDAGIESVKNNGTTTKINDLTQ
jgi:uncharacterized protein YegP (UPF0339 family)